MVLRLIIGTWDPTTQRQRELQKKKTINNFLYISLPFIILHDYDVKLPNFTFYGVRKQENEETRKSKSRYCSLWIQLKESSRTFDKQTKWAGVIATKTERTKIHILSDVFAPIASLDLKVPNMAWSSSESNRKYISPKKYKTILIVNSLTILTYIR